MCGVLEDRVDLLVHLSMDEIEDVFYEGVDSDVCDGEEALHNVVHSNQRRGGVCMKGRERESEVRYIRLCRVHVSVCIALIGGKMPLRISVCVCVRARARAHA